MKRLKARMARAGGTGLLKGEVWLGTALFRRQDMADTAENHLRLADRLGHSLVCLPVCDDLPPGPDLGYRHFAPRDLGQVAGRENTPVAAVIDGPFQQMVNRMGLMAVLSSWISRRDAIAETYTGICDQVTALIHRVLEHPVAALVIADDLASEAGPLVRPSDLASLCSPFYAVAASAAGSRGIPLLLHSCGRLDRLVPMLKAWQIDGFAAVQSRLNDLPFLYRAFDSRILVMAGIEYDHLDLGRLGEEGHARIRGLIAALGEDLVLSSSCGLYEDRFLDQLPSLYGEAASR